MKKYLIVNTGSTSKKYALYENNKKLFFSHFEGKNKSYIVTHYFDNQKIEKEISVKDFDESFAFLMNELISNETIADYSDVVSIGIRVVSPGSYFLKHRIVDDEYISQLQVASKKNPMHLPPLLLEIERIKKMFPNTTLFGISDSAFYGPLPEVAKIYGISTDVAKDNDIYRFGFHGLSVHSIVDKFSKIFSKVPKKVIVCHVGGGVSVVAVKDGQPIDMSMGFTPLEGVLMATRAGDLDPSAVLYLLEKTGMSISDMRKYLNSQCGLLGVSGQSSDIRDLIELEKSDDKMAKLALDFYAYRIRKYIGAYTAAMGGLDAIIFSGTVGERSFIMRKRILAELSNLGIKLSDEKNNKTISEDKIISSWLSRVKVAVSTTDEMNQLAKETLELTK